MIQIWRVTLPETFNAAAYFVDRNLEQGRGGTIAIECGEQRVTYAEVAAQVNRFANALRRLGVQPEQRVALILLTPRHSSTAFSARSKRVRCRSRSTPCGGRVTISMR